MNYGPSGERLYEERAKPAVKQRSYAMAMGGRLTTGWRATQSSADQELNLTLPILRGRARELTRNAGYALRAKIIVVNNVIGPGIGMQCNVRNNRDRLTDVNDAIEEAWCTWSRASSCHTGGKLHFSDLERAAMAQVFEAGECFLRKHYAPFGDSEIPIALELIESERLADTFTTPGPIVTDNDVRLAVEVDKYQRPLAYWIREHHPGDLRINTMTIDRVERVPADQIIHLHVQDRWPQVRGEPWLHAAARRLNDMDGYSEAEIVAARGAATYMGFIRTPDESLIPPDTETGAQRNIQMEPGMMEQLPPGWDVTVNNPNRPNPAMDPFMRMMLREVAAGVGVSYESLSRDYSQSNYSSSRLALLDDRDLWRQLQQWWIRTFREPFYREWLKQAVFANAIKGLTIEAYFNDVERYTAARWKPRGWSWVDPTKEAEAAKISVRSGFDSLTHIIAQTGDGRDLEDVIEERKLELQMLDEAGYTTDTNVIEPVPSATPAAAAGATETPQAAPAGGSSPNLQVVGGKSQ